MASQWRLMYGYGGPGGTRASPTLAAARSAGRLKQALKQYTKPALLILGELGYLPIDKAGADLLFRIISLRYEQRAIIITSNRAFKEWPTIFNNDSTLTAAILDRLLPHADTVIIAGKSFRMKDQLAHEPAVPITSPGAPLLMTSSCTLRLPHLHTPICQHFHTVA